MIFWQQVKQIMTDSKLTIKTLSEETGLNYLTLQNQINRSIEPIATNAYKIATVLNVSVEYLVTGDTSLLTDIQKTQIADKEKIKNLSEELKEKTEELKNIKATLRELLK